MHVIKVEMVFFEFLQMVMHLRKLRKNGQFLKMNLVMLGFHWPLTMLIHLGRSGLFTWCDQFLLSTITFLLGCQ
jgi:hypothetical protein